ncbi:hypothetical protein [Sphingomonas sp.]|uniref:hypothetical protein n=1 Tax=Sphingomonas sp. TaxID=28214 RepID=UPI0031E39584
MTERRFLLGFVTALATLGLVVGAFQLLFTRVGEIGLARVVDRQLAAPNGDVLFLSGVNQNSHRYKLMLFDRQRPQVIAIGSSRAMEVRAEFFDAPFVTLGGAVNNLANLEAVADHVAKAPARPKLAIVYVDPWLFNARYTDNQGPVPSYPRYVSADMLWAGAKALRRGNWIAQSFRSPNLGIYAISRNEGFARDGSQYYNLTGDGAYDAKFALTFARIDGDKQNFQRNTRAYPRLVGRICAAVRKVRAATGAAAVVAPPFADSVWRRLSQPDYAYIADGYAQLQACLGDIPFFDYADPARIDGSSECEFIDGLHGGDVTYARTLLQMAATDPAVRAQVNAPYLQAFVGKYRGHAGGTVLARDPAVREADFLQLGCRK